LGHYAALSFVVKGERTKNGARKSTTFLSITLEIIWPDRKNPANGPVEKIFAPNQQQ
jgi:hypothetical protein